MTASLEWDHRGDTPVLQVVGRWTLDQRKPELSEVWRQGGRLPERLAVQVNVAAWDSSLLALLRRLQRLATEQQVVLNLQGLPDGVERLLEMADSPSTQAKEADKPVYGWVERLGIGAIYVSTALTNS